MKLRGLTVALACAAMAGCGGTARMFSYGTELADARVRLGEAEFQIYVHPRDPTLMVQRSLSQTGGGTGVAAEFEAAANSFMAPAGCQATGTVAISAGTWETTYACPAGVNLPALVAAQRDQLRAGAAIRRNP